MDEETDCGVKKILRKIFWKRMRHMEAQNTDAAQSDAQRTEDHRAKSTKRSRANRLRRPQALGDLRHLARENSLAPYLGLTGGEFVVMDNTPVAIMSGNQLREFLGENPRITYAEGPEFDPFTEASASCPVAEESFDSGLLKMTTPWFMEYPI